MTGAALGVRKRVAQSRVSLSRRSHEGRPGRRRLFDVLAMVAASPAIEPTLFPLLSLTLFMTCGARLPTTPGHIRRPS